MFKIKHYKWDDGASSSLLDTLWMKKGTKRNLHHREDGYARRSPLYVDERGSWKLYCLEGWSPKYSTIVDHNKIAEFKQDII